MEGAGLQAKAFWDPSLIVGAVGPLFPPWGLLPWTQVKKTREAASANQEAPDKYPEAMKKVT